VKHIPVLLQPIDEIDCGLGVTQRDTWDHFMSCYHCGSPYFVVKVVEMKEEDDAMHLGKIDHNFVCAVCGTENGGIFVDNKKGTAVRR
jgi:hypothetical protein